MGGKALSAAVGAVALIGAAPLLAAAATPEQILSAYSSGVVRLVSSCKSGQFEGTGFLVGPQVMLTARHLASDPVDGSACAMSIMQQGTGQTTFATSYSAWETASPSDTQQTDLVMVALNSALVGHYFQLSTASARVGETVIGLRYPPNKPVRVAAGRVTAVGLVSGVPTLQISIPATRGSFGGPIVNVHGYVVALTQRGALAKTSTGQQGLDLARFLKGRPAVLCQGSFASLASTVCSSASAAPTPKPATIKDCWVSAKDVVDPKSKLFQTGDARPTVYFVERLAHKLKRAMGATLSIVQPNGQPWSVVPARWSWTSGHTTAKTVGPISWGTVAQAPRGLWTFIASLSDGSTCSFALKLSS